MPSNNEGVLSHSFSPSLANNRKKLLLQLNQTYECLKWKKIQAEQLLRIYNFIVLR